VDHSSSPIELKEYTLFFKELRHSLGNTALLLSGGAALGVFHIGIIKAMHEQGLLPRIIAGSSAGAIMAAIVGCTPESEFSRLLRLDGVNIQMLEEETPPDRQGSWLYPWARKLGRLFSQGVIFDAEVLRRSLRENIGDITFLEAYRLTNRVLNVTVSSGTNYEMPQLLNYLTAPNVLVWSAVVASCSLPALFASAPLLAKDHHGASVPWTLTDERWIDGSVENDLPMARLSELFNVNHFIVCQVNAHVYPFVSSSPRQNGSIIRKTMLLLRSELDHRLDQAIAVGLFPRAAKILKSVLNQRYEGDITIVPELHLWSDVLHMLVDPPPSKILETIRRGERATWPKLAVIRSQLQAELTLDEILLHIRDRLFLMEEPSDSLDSSSQNSEDSSSKYSLADSTLVDVMYDRAVPSGNSSAALLSGSIGNVRPRTPFLRRSPSIASINR